MLEAGTVITATNHHTAIRVVLQVINQACHCGIVTQLLLVRGVPLVRCTEYLPGNSRIHATSGESRRRLTWSRYVQALLSVVSRVTNKFNVRLGRLPVHAGSRLW